MEENKVTKENSKMGMGILIGLLIAAVIGFGGYFVYNEFINKDTKSSSNSSSTKETNSNTEKETKKEEAKDFDLTKFDEKKEAINGNSGWGYKLSNDNFAKNVGLDIALNADNKSATITIDWGKYFKVYGISASNGAVLNYNVTNFSSNIKEVLLAGFGQASGYETAFYVMNDGTVEYTPIKHGLGNNGASEDTVLKSYGKINNVNDVVKLAIATDYCINSNQNCVSEGAYNVLGIKADGSFYDLSKIVSSLDYYKQY